MTRVLAQRGVGLGRYILQRLLDRLGGGSAVDRAPGRGSTFRVWLPQQPETAADRSEMAPRRSPAPRVGRIGESLDIQGRKTAYVGPPPTRMAQPKAQQSTVWFGGLVGLLALALATPAAARFYPRGDATCGDGLTAADLVATARGIGGDSGCGNVDCDRDGALTAADARCAAGCLFGVCPVPGHAPRLTGIAADSAPEAVPGSVVRISVANLGPIDANKRVTVNGLEAEVVEQTEIELLVALPVDLPTGPAELVVIDGDLDGPPIAIEIAPPVPLGAPDSFDGMLGLVDTVLARLLDLDVEAAFGDNAPIIRQEYARYRAELAEQRAALAADATLGEAARIVLDAAADASGAPEQLRAQIAELEALTVGDGGVAAPPNPYLAFQNGARTLQIAGAVVRAAGTAAAAAGTTISAGPILLAIGTGLAINAGAVLVGGNALTPLIAGIDYLDADGKPRRYPTAGGIAVVRGYNFDTVTTDLKIRVRSGSYAGDTPTAVGDTINYRLPDNIGFCGKVTFELFRAGGFVSNPVQQRVQPELLTLPANALSGAEIQGTSRGASCELSQSASAFFDSGAPGSSKEALISARDGHLTYMRVPDVLPGAYKVSLTVEGVRSDPAGDVPIDIRNRLTGLQILCPPTIYLAGSGESSVPSCTVVTQPDFTAQPQPSVFRWLSSRANVATVQVQTDKRESVLTARNIGETNISVTLEASAGPVRILASSPPVAVTVVDDTDPRISISSTATSPVQPGASIPVTVTASDNYRLLLVELAASGDAVASGGAQQILDCTGKKTCSAMVTVGLKESDFSQPTVTITATARDAGANSAGSNTLTFTIARDTSCPAVTIQQPASGGTVNAGETVMVVALARDDQPGDTGVKSFVYRASGPALTAPVAQTLPLPLPQAAPPLRFTFSVKQPSELTDVEDKNITISVEALDAANPPNTCGPQTVSVSVVGVLDLCSGGITTDNPAGFIGEPFTVTVALTGAGADEITRVTSINPGGAFDLEPQGGGVYTVTLFYQGAGGFTLRFVAFDAAGEERCAGSIGLESLGPEPGDGVAAQRRGSEPAGGSRR